MLALSRKRGQEILFYLPDGDSIMVRIKDIQGRQVKIVIDAPSNVRILRNELELKNGSSQEG